jgi:hypothetical protein
MKVKEYKWVCIDNKGQEEELTLNKFYTNIDSGYADSFCIVIKNDLGIVSEYYQPLKFVSIDEWREMKLKELGI